MSEHEHNSETQYSPEARDMVFTIPNLISVLRIISIPIIAMLVSRHEMITALIVLAISAVSDSLDGIIARTFNQVSKVGQILDPIADRLLIFCSILALGVAGIIPWWMLIVVGARDVLMAVLILVLAQHDYGPLPVHFVGKTGTAMLMMSIVALIFHGHADDVHRGADLLGYLEHAGGRSAPSGGIGRRYLGRGPVLAGRSDLLPAGA